MIYVFFKKYYIYLIWLKDYIVNLFVLILDEIYFFDFKMLLLVDKYILVWF